jgi:hypothetical protein
LEYQSVARTGEFQVMSNFNVFWPSSTLGGNSTTRFNTATSLLATNPFRSVYRLAAILNAVKQGSTQWSYVFDNITGDLYIFLRENFTEVAKVNIHDEFARGNHDLPLTGLNYQPRVQIIPPTVLAVTPLNHAVDWGLNDLLKITMSKNVTFGSGDLTIRRVADKTVFEVIDSSRMSNTTLNEVVIDPSLSFEPGAGYYIRIDSSLLKDEYGNRFRGILSDTLWAFKAASGSTEVDSIPPTILQVPDTRDSNLVVIEFSEELDLATAQDTANYTINNGITVRVASLTANTVSLVTTSLSEGITYTVTVTGVTDNSANKNPIAPGSQATFAYLAPVTSGNITGYWSMDAVIGDKVDDGAGDNDGTVKGAVWTADGKYNGGLQFDGNDSLDLGTSIFGLDSTNEFTIALWFNATSLATGDLIKRGLYVNPYRIYLSGSRTGTTVRTSGSQYLTGNIRFQTNIWYHVALTYKSGERIIYVNGQVDTSNAVTGSLDLTAGRVTVVGENFTGIIDEVYILNRAVDQSEINDIMNNVYGSGTTGLAPGHATDRAEAVPFIMHQDDNGLTLESIAPARALVYDTHGNLIQVLTTRQPAWNTTILHTGIYLTKVICGDQVYYQRIMVCR